MAVFTDNFDRPDGPLADGVNWQDLLGADGGKSDGTNVISGGRATLAQAQFGENDSLCLQVLTKNQAAEFEVVSGRRIVLFVRRTGAFFFGAYMEKDDPYWYIMDGNNNQVMDSYGDGSGTGAGTVVEAPATWAADAKVRLEAYEDGTLKLYYNTTKLYEGVASPDPTGTTEAGKTGFGLTYQGTVIDNWKCEDLTAPGAGAESTASPWVAVIT